MTVARSGLVVLGGFLIGFWLLMQAGWLGDVLFDGLIWAAILLALSHQAVNAFRGKAHSTDLTAGLPASWRRWILGESNKP
jgi:hypothetical protein